MTTAEVWVRLAAGVAASDKDATPGGIAERTDVLLKEFNERFTYDGHEEKYAPRPEEIRLFERPGS